MIQPTSSVGYGVKRIWRRTYSLGRIDRSLQPFLVADERVERRLHLAHPRRHPDRALLDHADPQTREALEHAVEDHRRQRLRGRDGDAHVVDGAEVLLAAVEVGRDRQPVAEVVRVDQLTGAADVEHDRHAGLAGRRPHGVEARRGSVSARAGSPTRPAAPPRPISIASFASAGARSRSASGTYSVAQQPGVDGTELDHAAVVGTGARRSPTRCRRRAPSRAVGGCGTC